MKRALLTTVLALALFGGTAAFSGQAQAGSIVAKSGYVCDSLFYYFPGSYYGNYGMTAFTLYTGANCTGSYVSWISAFSTGATGQGSATLFYQQTLLRLTQAYANRAGTSHAVNVYIDSASLGLYYGDL